MVTMERTMYSLSQRLKTHLAALSPQGLMVILALFTSLVFSQVSLANEAIATASVSQTRLSTNEVFNLQIVYSDVAHREDFDPSVLNPEFTQGRLQFGTSRYSINGKVTIRSEWNLTLATKKVGEITIPSFEINGSKTDPITLHVSTDPSAPKQDDLIAFDDSISKTTLYPKETATFISRLLVKTDPRGLQNTQLTPPSGEGLNLTPIGDANQYQKIINGIETTVVEQKYHVSAEQAGDHQLIPARIQASVISISPATGARRIVPVDVQAKPIQIHVKAKPSSFKGAWLPTQSLTLQQGWQDSNGETLTISKGQVEAKVGQPITRMLALVVQDVSAENLPEIKIDYPASVRVYSEKPKFGQDKAGNTVMTLKQVIMPKKSGQITLPSVTVPWWNSQLGQTETAQAAGLILNTKMDENAPPIAAGSNASHQDEAPLNTDSEPDIAANHEASTQTITTAGYWPYLTALFAGLWLITLLLFIQQKRRQVKNTHTHATQGAAARTVQASDLVSALHGQDGVKIQSAYRQWQAQYSHLETNLQQQIETHMQRLMACLYGAQQHDYDVKDLITLIKQAEKSSRKNQGSTADTIAKL